VKFEELPDRIREHANACSNELFFCKPVGWFRGRIKGLDHLGKGLACVVKSVRISQFGMKKSRPLVSGIRKDVGNTRRVKRWLVVANRSGQQRSEWSGPRKIQHAAITSQFASRSLGTSCQHRFAVRVLSTW